MVLKVKPNAAKPRTDPLRGDDLKAKPRFIFLQYFPQCKADISPCFTRSSFREATAEQQVTFTQCKIKATRLFMTLTIVRQQLAGQASDAQRRLLPEKARPQRHDAQTDR